MADPNLTPEPPLSPGAQRRAERMATPRMQREWRTIEAMLQLYCRAHHHAPGGMCEDCATLLDYAGKRLAGCPFGADKPTCAHCTIHCYGPVQREQVRVMMRWAGPRMLRHHPVLALAHLVDGRRVAPPKPRGRAG